MADMSEFLRHITPHANALPDPVAFQYLRDAAVAFCKRTRAWRFVAHIDMTEGQTPLVPVPEGSTIFEIESVHHDDRPLDKVPYDSIDFRHEPGLPHEYAMGADNRLTVWPTQSGKLKIVMFLKPSQDTEELPDFMLEDHGKNLAEGALADILLLPNQPYSDPQKAMGFAMAFGNYLDQQFALQKRGKQYARLRSKPNWF